MNIFRKPVIGAATFALFFSLSAQAQNEGDDFVIDEVFVTAEKRDSSQQDTPQSVSAISGDETEAIGITITNDAIAIVNISGIGTSAFGVGAWHPRPGCRAVPVAGAKLNSFVVFAGKISWIISRS